MHVMIKVQLLFYLLKQNEGEKMKNSVSNIIPELFLRLKKK